MTILEHSSAIRYLMITGAAIFLWGCSQRKPERAAEKPVATKSAKIRATKSPAASPRRPMPQPLFAEAALNGRADEIRGALRSGTKANVADENGRTALMLAAFNGHTGVVRLLIDAGAEVRARDRTGRTALMYASTGPSTDTVSLLLHHGAEVNVVDSQENWTALMFAAAEGHSNVVRILLDRGADPALKDVDGDNAAAFALQRGHKKLAALLQKAEQAK